MQLSLHADYSCRVLIYLATKGDRSSIDEIAASYAVSKNHLVKVVHQLGKMGFIETTRGRGGGIQLARPAEQISLGEVIRKTESNLNVVPCLDAATSNCVITESCGLKPWLANATNAFLQSLDGVTLADVTKNRRKLEAHLGLIKLPG